LLYVAEFCTLLAAAVAQLAAAVAVAIAVAAAVAQLADAQSLKDSQMLLDYSHNAAESLTVALLLVC
jgi:hypothetical protein